MSFRCPECGEYINEENCHDCDNTDCNHHPEYINPTDTERLERLRSSEFATDVMNRLSAVFPIPQEKLTEHLDTMFGAFERYIDDAIVLACKHEIQRRAVAYIDSRMKEILDEAFTKAVDEEVFHIQNDDKVVTKTIRQHAFDRIRAFLQTQSKSSYRDDPIEKAIGRLVEERVKVAVDEIKRDAIDKFNKEAMKRMMQGMAKAIGEDARLLKLLTNG